MAENRILPSEASLITEYSDIIPGKTFSIGLHIELKTGWHTYWKNSGDAGSQTKIQWELPQGFYAQDMQWPVPEKFAEPPLATYGYQNEVFLISNISTPSIIVDKEVTMIAHARWLVCAEVCIPQKKSFTLTLPVTSQQNPGNANQQKLFEQTRLTHPQKIENADNFKFKHYLNAIELLIPTSLISNSAIDNILFIPDEDGIIDDAGEQIFSEQNEFYKLQIPKDLSLRSPPQKITGLLVFTNEQNKISFELNSSLPKVNNLILSASKSGKIFYFVISLVSIFAVITAMVAATKLLKHRKTNLIEPKSEILGRTRSQEKIDET